MAGGKENYLSNALFNVAAYSPASSISGGGTEVTGGSYARQVTCNTTNFPTTTTETIQNATAISFGTASANWGRRRSDPKN